MPTTTSGGRLSVLDDERINGLDFFGRGLGASISGSWATRTGTLVNSSSEIENYNWLGATPQLQKWEGEALAKQLNDYSYTLTNEEYESTLGFRKADIRRDKVGQIRSRLMDQGMKLGDHWNKLAATLLLNGEATTNGAAYDGQAFFDTDHDESGSNQTNDLTATEVPSANVSTTTAPTATEAAGIIFETIGHAMTLTDDQGDPINSTSRNWVVVVGTSRLWAGYSQAVGLESLTSGATNPVMGLRSEGFSVSVILEPRLSASTTKAYFLNTDGMVKPLLLQEEVPIDIQEDDPGPRSKDIYTIASATRAAGYGLWQKAMLVTHS
jgi:phage major head subunit gpT-like protein